MSDETLQLSVPQLAGIAATFNEIARHSFPDQASADAGNKLFESQKAALLAARAEIDAFQPEIEEQITILQDNAPPQDPLAQIAEQFGIDPAQLDDEQKEQLAQMFGVDLTPVTPDSPEIAAAKKLASETAEDALHEIEGKLAPAALAFEELRASILAQVLPTDVFNAVADQIAPPQYFAQINAAFVANNAPVLAGAFTPKQA